MVVAANLSRPLAKGIFIHRHFNAVNGFWRDVNGRATGAPVLCDSKAEAIISMIARPTYMLH